MPDQNDLEKREPEFRRLARLAGQRAAEVGRKGTEMAEEATDQLRRGLGEDYYAILDQSPIVRNTMERAPLLDGGGVLLETAFNVPWVTTLLWSTAAGSAVALHGPIAKVAGELAHYGPGHVAAWDAVNKFMDSVRGGGHRLKFGHSIEYLPQIVEEFGIGAVPAFFIHLAQDFSTISGIPIVPSAWQAKSLLQAKGLSASAAAGAVSVSFSGMLGAWLVITAAGSLWKAATSVLRNRKLRRHLDVATAAAENRDYLGAAANYKLALELDRTPGVLLALGHSYMQKASTRHVAHNVFKEALDRLANRPETAAPYGGAQLSVRGLAGIYALSTADVLAGIHPEHWNDHLQDLVSAAVNSFESTAARLEDTNVLRKAVLPPPRFSASINYYLAAKSASYYPLDGSSQDIVMKNIRHALRSLGLVAQYDEERLRQPTDALRQLWARELLPPSEAETTLATY